MTSSETEDIYKWHIILSLNRQSNLQTNRLARSDKWKISQKRDRGTNYVGGWLIKIASTTAIRVRKRKRETIEYINWKFINARQINKWSTRINRLRRNCVRIWRKRILQDTRRSRQPLLGGVSQSSLILYRSGVHRGRQIYADLFLSALDTRCTTGPKARGIKNSCLPTRRVYRSRPTPRLRGLIARRFVKPSRRGSQF